MCGITPNPAEGPEGGREGRNEEKGCRWAYGGEGKTEGVNQPKNSRGPDRLASGTNERRKKRRKSRYCPKKPVLRRKFVNSLGAFHTEGSAYDGGGLPWALWVRAAKGGVTSYTAGDQHEINEHSSHWIQIGGQLDNRMERRVKGVGGAGQ